MEDTHTFINHLFSRLLIASRVLVLTVEKHTITGVGETGIKEDTTSRPLPTGTRGLRSESSEKFWRKECMSCS